MNKLLDNDVSTSEEVQQEPLSSAELIDLRKLLERDRKRQSVSNISDFPGNAGAAIDYAKLAERIYDSRRERERVFNEDMFADPAWDLLLDLFVKSARNEQVSISSACQGANVPEATALRYLKALTEKKYVERSSHPNDKRSTTLKMTPLGNKLMIRWLEYFQSN